MSDVLTVVGKNGGIVEKSAGWYEVQVQVAGKKYPVRLATKQSGLLDKVRETNGEIATFHYTETESSKINPNTQRPYTNRYLEDVSPGGTPGSGTGDGDRMTKEEWNAKDRRDFRSRAWAQTISAFSHTIPVDEDPVLTFARLKPFQRKLYEDIVGDLDPKPQGQQPQAQPAQQSQIAEPDSTYDEPPPHDDDDIPF